MKSDIKEKTDKLKAYLEEHRCGDVVVIDMENECSWTDAFVIATVSSVGHLRGVVHQLWGELNELGLTVNNRHKSPGDDGWELIDCGDVIIHLMSEELRSFYNLEKLWKATENLV